MRSASGFNWKEIAIRKHAWNISKVFQSLLPFLQKNVTHSYSTAEKDYNRRFFKFSIENAFVLSLIVRQWYYMRQNFKFRARMRMHRFLSKFSQIVNFGLYHPLNVILKTELAKIEFFSVMKSRLWFNDREY